MTTTEKQLKTKTVTKSSSPKVEHYTVKFTNFPPEKTRRWWTRNFLLFPDLVRWLSTSAKKKLVIELLKSIYPTKNLITKCDQIAEILFDKNKYTPEAEFMDSISNSEVRTTEVVQP